jgi:hypothetical protein
MASLGQAIGSLIGTVIAIKMKPGPIVVKHEHYHFLSGQREHMTRYQYYEQQTKRSEKKWMK